VVYEPCVHSAHEPFRRALEEELGEPITCDGLTCAWSLLQRKRGHRHSTDDVLTAAYALEHGGAPDDATTLDLGAGIGTVGLLVLWGLGEGARLVGVEAQEVSFRLFRENLRMNGLEARVSPVHGDLRTTTLGQRFPLVTGSPPYFDVKAGVVPSDSQKAHARFELRGTVADYALAARRALTPDGRFVFCFPTPQKARALEGVRAAGLAIVTRRDVVPRAGLSPLFSLFACRIASSAGADEVDPVEEPPFLVRDAGGGLSEAMRRVRARFGWPDSSR